MFCVPLAQLPLGAASPLYARVIDDLHGKEILRDQFSSQLQVNKFYRLTSHPHRTDKIYRIERVDTFCSFYCYTFFSYCEITFPMARRPAAAILHTRK